MIAHMHDDVRNHDRVPKAAPLVAALLFMLPAGALFAQAAAGPTQNAAAGARVFGTKGCVQCHAIRGMGGSVGPDLGLIRERRSFFELAAAMWNHLPTMQATMEEAGMDRPGLTPQETGDFIAFLFTLDYFDAMGDVDSGRALFAEKKCVLCHQVQGTGGVIGPNLDYLSQYSSPMFVAAAMWGHGPGMAETMRSLRIERPRFTGREFRDLMAFFQSVSETSPEGPMYVLPGRADVGRELFSSKSCLRCHSVRGSGGQIGSPLGGRGLEWSASDFVAALWNKAPSMQAAMLAAGILMPELSAEEMADLVAYLYSVNYFSETGDARRGRQLVTQKGCLQCHKLDTRGGTTAPDLAEITGLVTQTEVVAALWSHTTSGMEEAAGESTGWPVLSPSDLADLVAFLRGLRQAP
jgi:mono/diheme cytochrome c family protein